MENNSQSFKGHTIISCGVLSPELNHLKTAGFLDADKILYTRPGLHEVSDELERQLKRQLDNAKKYSAKIIVVYGNMCYINSRDPFRDIDKLIKEHTAGAVRIEAKNCIDALVDNKERERLSKGGKIYWLTPGWLKYWKQIFKEWDEGKANETFPQNDKAIFLDGLNIFDEYSREYPEKILELSDWMSIPIEPVKISLERLKKLLTDCLKNEELRN